MAVPRDVPCPVCAHTVTIDLSYLATKFPDGTERWGRCHACANCGVLRFYDSIKPEGFTGELGSVSVDPTDPG